VDGDQNEKREGLLEDQNRDQKQGRNIAVDMLSEVGDPIMEDENESESKKNSRLNIPSSKNKSSPNRK
jgi:hypothetical protein